MRYHRIFSLVFALAVGITLALYSFQRIADPEPARQRAREEAVVMSAREILRAHVSSEKEIEIADPLAPNRVAGKVYVYPNGNGWEVSGHYRRGDVDRWHPFLMALDEKVELISLLVRDNDVATLAAAAADPKFSVEQYRTR